MGLKEYIIRRLILLIPVVFGVAVLIFAVLQIIPLENRAVIYIRNPRQMQNIQDIITRYGLDKPVWEQFTLWLNEVLHGNFGYSAYYQKPVLQGLLDRFPATIELVIYCAPLIIFFGIWLGITAAVNRDKMPDHISRVLSILGTSLPSFFFGIILIAIFVAQLKWTSVGRITNMGLLISAMQTGKFHQYTGLMTIDSLLNGNLALFVDALSHLILPIIVMIFIQSAVLVRVMRSSMLESLSKTYIVAARAKGLSRKEVIYKHARRNALIPVITLSGLIVGGMLTGLIITETVFNFPGVGNYAANAAAHFDVAVVVAYAMFSAIIFVIANLIVDVLYAYIDPRIRLG
jgi:peptide/nickel transport system permease protein